MGFSNKEQKGYGHMDDVWMDVWMIVWMYG